MNLALYHPKWGYYTTNSHVFGAKGDFITAPELTPLFGYTLAKAIAPMIEQGLHQIYEFGAGQGKLACDLLSQLNAPLQRYFIIEVSGLLKHQQQAYLRAKLPDSIFKKIAWISELPNTLEGLVIGNEVLDAMPVRRFRFTHNQIEEAYVFTNKNPDETVTSKIIYKPCDTATSTWIQHKYKQFGPWPEGYETEYSPQANAFVRTLTEKLNGLCLMIDYGMEDAHYYHPQHHRGHLRAHRKHTAHDDFCAHPGQQDLTCHVNFSEILGALQQQGGQLEGYCTQGRFLLHHGLMQHAEQLPKFGDLKQSIQIKQAIQTLVSESDMGLHFKIMAWSKHYTLTNPELIAGFVQHDLSHVL